MTCKQYRACLMGVIVTALLCGMLICYKYGRKVQIPAEGVLVQQTDIEEEYEAVI